MKHSVFSRFISAMVFCALMLQIMPGIFLSTRAAAPDNIALDGGYSLAFEADTYLYEVKLPAGHPRIPLISATAGSAVTVTQAAMPVSQTQATGYVQMGSAEYQIIFTKDASLGFHLQYGDYHTFTPETEAVIKGFVSSAPEIISVTDAGVLHALALSDSPVTISALAEDDSVLDSMTVDQVVKAPLNLFLITGQSNAYGSYDIPSGMNEASFTAAQMAKTLKPAPGTVLCTDVSNKGVILNDMYDLSQGRSGFSPALGKTWYDLTGEKTLMLQTAVGGAPIEAWMKPEGGVRNTYNYIESNFYETTKKAYDHTIQKLQAENSGYELRHTYAYWLQGETGMGNSYDPNKNGAGIGGWKMGDTSNILTSQQYYNIFMKNMEYFTGEFGCEFMGILLVRALAGAASAESLELQLLTDLTPTRAAQYALNNTNGKQISIVSRVCDIARMESYADTSVPGWGYMGCNNLHYNQIGHNANGVEAAKNTYGILFGRKAASDLEIIAPNGRDRLEDGQQIVLSAGQSYQTAAMVLPMTAQAQKVTYQVADETVCTVDAFGKITASEAAAGKSTTVTYISQSGIRKSITVKVEDDSASGTLNGTITWTYANGTLTLTGIGATPTYTAATRPFAAISDRVTKVVVGEGITELGGYTLYQMSKVQSVQLPSTLQKIQVRAMANNTALKSLEIPESVTVLGAYCFEKSALEELTFLGAAPNTISGSKPCNSNTYTLRIACNDTSWTSAKQTALGGTQTVEPQHDYQDGKCSLCGQTESSAKLCGADITWSFADGVLTLTGTGSTYNYELADISKDSYVFLEIKDQVKEIVVGEGITILGKHIFYKMPVEKVTLPHSLTHIDTRALGGGGKLKEVVIYSKLANLGYNCLVGSGATDIYILGGVPKNISTTPLGGLTYNLHIPCTDTSWTEDMLSKLGGTRTVVTEHTGFCPECGGGSDVAGGSCGASVTWKLQDGVLTLSGSGATDEFVRTAATDTVNYPWAEHMDAITSIVVEEGITNLDNYCFYNLSKVTSVTLPESLKRVETRIFTGCTSLKELTIPAALEWAGFEAFAGSGITDLRFTADPPKGFSGTAPCKNLAYNLHIPCNNTAWTDAKVAALGGTATVMPAHNYVDGVCTLCSDLPTGQVGGSCGENVTWKLENGVLTLSGSGATAEYTRNSAADTVNYPWANYINAITSIVVEEGITNLDNYCFYNLKNVTSVTLPASLQRLETRIFKGCAALTQVTVPGKLAYLGLEAFAGSGITDLYFADAPGSFSGTKPCGDQSIRLHIPCNNTTWTAEKLAAMGNGLSLVLEHTWEGTACTVCGAKENTPVTGITLSQTSVSVFCKETKSLSATVTPKDATNTVLEWTSSDNAIATVSPVGTVTGVAPGTAIITATAKDGSGISASCTVTVKDGQGGSCGDHATWTFADGVLTISGWGSTTKFVRNAQNDTIYYPWAEFKDQITRVVVGEGITVLNNYAFYNCANIRSVRLPSTLKEIAYGAFQGTSRLSTITIPAKVTKLGSQAFKGSGLKSITFAGLSPSSYGKNLFDGVTAKVYYLCNDSERSYGKGLTWEKTHTFAQEDGVRRCSKCHELDGVPVTAITLDQTEILLMIGDSLKLTATVEPADAAYPSVVWESSEEAVVTVSEDGTLTALEAGSAQIIAKAKDGGDVQAVCNVTVRQGVGGKVGDLFWIYHYGKLTITGQGPMPQSSMAPWALYADEIVELTVENGVTTIADKSFAGLEQLAIVHLPDTLTQIGAGAFENTRMLTEIEIPASVTELGSRAFAGSSLSQISFRGYLPEATADVFAGVTATATIPCDDTQKDMGGTITWQQGHDYQPSGEKQVCINCGHETDAQSAEKKSDSTMNWLWWVVGIAAATVAAVAVVLGLKKKEK